MLGYPKPLNHTSCELRVFCKTLDLPDGRIVKNEKARSQAPPVLRCPVPGTFLFFDFLKSRLFHFCSLRVLGVRDHSFIGKAVQSGKTLHGKLTSFELPLLRRGTLHDEIKILATEPEFDR